MEKDLILRLKNITKEFPGVKALDSISFDVERGTVHALIGENGAGKSTMIKILAGIYQPNDGTMVLDETERHFFSPIEARAAGISVVHQEIKLAETLSVAENMFLGNLPLRNNLIDWPLIKRRARKIVEELGIDIDIDSSVEKLTVAKKQIVEIMHAINNDSQILIMDEPSAVLTERELEVLFGIIRKLRVKGITIIYISHRLEEVFTLADNVTIFRDGQHIATLPVFALDKSKMVSMMVGRDMGQEYPKEDHTFGEVVLEVKGLCTESLLKNISFEVHQGEIFGFAGLVGAGRTELARAILGIDKTSAGEVYVRGKKVQYRSLRDAIRDGLGLVPEDRKLQGLVQIMSVRENNSLVAMDKVIRGGILRTGLEKEYAEEYVRKLGVSTPSIETEVQYLSGGNQQKVVIAKWLMHDSEILILDEPTRGIDVGAKSEIYKLINAMVREGKTVIIISSEMSEILGMCDRIMIMHEGEKKGELSYEEATQEKIMMKCI